MVNFLEISLPWSRMDLRYLAQRLYLFQIAGGIPVRERIRRNRRNASVHSWFPGTSYLQFIRIILWFKEIWHLCKNLYLDRSKKVFFVFFSRYSWMIWTEKSLIWTIIKEENSVKNDEMDGRMSLWSFNSDEMLLKTRLPDSCLFIWAIQI